MIRRLTFPVIQHLQKMKFQPLRLVSVKYVCGWYKTSSNWTMAKLNLWSLVKSHHSLRCLKPMLPLDVRTSLGLVLSESVSMDKEMAMTQHMNNVCKSLFFHLRNIQRIIPYLTIPATGGIVHASITSRLDYCNSLLHGTTKTDISKLQRVQNSAARLITGGRKMTI